MADNNATLTIEGKDYQLPITKGTLGRPVIDIGALQDAGHWSYDPGFKVTAPVESKITFIDGGKGELLHRGYPIDQLANNAEYLEVCYALLHGDLPNAEQKDAFFTKIREHSAVHDQLRKFFEGFRRDAHPMAIMVSMQGEDFVHRASDHVIRLVIDITRRGKHHIQEVFCIVEVVTRIHEWLALRVFITHCCKRWHFCNQANGCDFAM